MPRVASQRGTCPGVAQAERLARMEAAVRTVIRGLGEDVDREGLRDTPKRVAKALIDVTSGYWQDPSSVIGSALFHESIVKEGNSGIVLVRDIDFASTSEETLLPFHGRCHIAYIPEDGVVLGLSKLARITKCYSKRLQSQQRLSSEIAAAFQMHVPCRGVAVILQARHLAPSLHAPPEKTMMSLAGCFMHGSQELEELLELLGIADVTADTSSVSALLPTLSYASGGLSADSVSSGLGSVVGPQTPAASEKDTDGDSDDVAMEGDSPEPMEAAVQQLLLEIGEDVTRPALQGTARRYIASLFASTSGYHQKLPNEWSMDCACPPVPSVISCDLDAMAQEQDSQGRSSSTCASSTMMHMDVPYQIHQTTVAFHSQCEHHMLPFYGNVHVAYTSDGSGSSSQQGQAQVKLADIEHIVAMFTQRLQVQERITHQVADAVAQLPGCGSVMVVVDAAHMCMVARGVENHAGSTTSVATRGLFDNAPGLRRAVLREARQAAMRCT